MILPGICPKGKYSPLIISIHLLHSNYHWGSSTWTLTRNLLYLNTAIPVLVNVRRRPNMTTLDLDLSLFAKVALREGLFFATRLRDAVGAAFKMNVDPFSGSAHVLLIERDFQHLTRGLRLRAGVERIRGPVLDASLVCVSPDLEVVTGREALL